MAVGDGLAPAGQVRRDAEERPAAVTRDAEAGADFIDNEQGAGLVGVMYILDEPSIGLHQRDNERLLATLTRLRDIGNTVIVVEHDRDVMLAADHILDLGPGAGEHGGEIVSQGTVEEVAAREGTAYIGCVLGDHTHRLRKGAGRPAHADVAGGRRDGAGPARQRAGGDEG